MIKIILPFGLFVLIYSCGNSDETKYECEELITKRTMCISQYDEDFNKIQKDTTSIDTTYSIFQDKIVEDKKRVSGVFFHSEKDLIEFQNKCKEASISKSDLSYKTEEWWLDKYKQNGVDIISIYDRTIKQSFEFEALLWNVISKKKWKTIYKIESVSCDLETTNTKEVSREEFYINNN